LAADEGDGGHGKAEAKAIEGDGGICRAARSEGEKKRAGGGGEASEEEGCAQGMMDQQGAKRGADPGEKEEASTLLEGEAPLHQKGREQDAGKSDTYAGGGESGIEGRGAKQAGWGAVQGVHPKVSRRSDEFLISRLGMDEEALDGDGRQRF
jgi:hypothetical protein